MSWNFTFSMEVVSEYMRKKKSFFGIENASAYSDDTNENEEESPFAVQQTQLQYFQWKCIFTCEWNRVMQREKFPSNIARDEKRDEQLTSWNCRMCMCWMSFPIFLTHTSASDGGQRRRKSWKCVENFYSFFASPKWVHLGKYKKQTNVVFLEYSLCCVEAN